MKQSYTLDTNKRRQILIGILYVSFWMLIINLMGTYTYRDMPENASIYFGMSSSVGSIAFGYIFSSLMALYSIKLIANKTFSSNLFLFLQIIFFIPSTVFVFSTTTPGKFKFYYVMFWLLFAGWYELLLSVSLGKRRFLAYLIALASKLFARKSVRITIGTAILLGAIIAAVLMGGDFRNLTLSTDQIYENRVVFSQIRVHWIMGVFLNSAGMIVPVLCCYYAYNKRHLLVLALVFVQIFFYTVASSRILLFYLTVALFAGYFRANQRKVLFLIFVYTAAILIENIIYATFSIAGEPWLTKVIRRFSLTPTYVSEKYFEYFKNNEADWLRSVYPRLARLLGQKSPFAELSIQRIIGTTYFNENNSANTGLLGGALGTFGYWCLLFSPMFYAIGLRLLDFVVRNIRNGSILLVITLIFMVQIINLNNFTAYFFRISDLLFFVIFLKTLRIEESTSMNIMKGRI